MLEKLEVRKTPKSEENSVFEKLEVAESPGEKLQVGKPGVGEIVNSALVKLEVGEI